MNIQYARVEVKSCPMSEDKCAAVVMRHIESFYSPNTPNLNQVVEEACGRYTRGKHTGKLRGWAKIEVCTVGGWQRLGMGQHHGRVLRPGQIVSISIEDFNGKAYFSAGKLP
jgi:hypothetical protein